MKKALQGFISFTNKVNEKIGTWAAWLTTVLVVVVCVRVFGRMIFDSGTGLASGVGMAYFLAYIFIGCRLYPEA